MVTRVTGIPDQNGIITISCGGDIIEVEVAGYALVSSSAVRPRSGGTGGGTRPTNPFDGPVSMSPFDTPFVNIVRGLKDKPYKLPSEYILSRTVTGRIDTAKIVKRVLDQMADPGKANPRGVVLGMNNVNLHELSALSQKISSEAPDVPIAVDFSGLLKR